MNIAWKEIKKNKAKFIIFLVSLDIDPGVDKNVEHYNVNGNSC